MPSRVSAAAAPGSSNTVPLRTTDDQAGNASAGHVLLLENAGVAAPVGAANPVPVTGGTGALGDGSLAVPTASAAVLSAGARRYLLVVNVGTADVWINFGAPASIGQGSIPIRPGGVFSAGTGGGFVPSDAVTAIAAGTGGALTVKMA